MRTALLLTVLFAAATASAQPPSEYRVAVILVRFADMPAPAWGRVQIANTMRQVTDQYLSYSYGRVRIVPEIYGWYNLAAAAGPACPQAAMKTLGEAAVRKERGETVLDGYRAIIFVTTHVSCGDMRGKASIGGSPAHVWIYNGNTATTISHELAHAFGRPHSGSRACSAGGCREHEYGDPYDHVGCGDASQHFNAAQKEAQGWLGAPGYPAITEVTVSGIYRIDAYEPAGGESSVRALKVLAGRKDRFGRDVFYYVESRTRENGGRVLLHTASSGGEEPLSVSLVDLAPTTAVFDPVLDPGQTFSDAAAGLTFKTVSTSADGAVVQIDITHE